MDRAEVSTTNTTIEYATTVGIHVYYATNNNFRQLYNITPTYSSSSTKSISIIYIQLATINRILTINSFINTMEFNYQIY